MLEIRQPRFLDYIRLISLSAIWGATFVFLKVALESVAPVTVSAARALIAGAILWTVGRYLGEPRLRTERRDVRPMVIGMLSVAVPFVLIGWGQQYIPAGRAAILLTSGSFMAMILSHVFTRDERASAGVALRLSFGVVGVVILLWDSVESSGRWELLGCVATLAAAASYAASSIVVRRADDLPIFTMSAIAMLSASIYLVPMALVMETPWRASLTVPAMASVAALGVVCTALAFWVRFTVVRENGAIFLSKAAFMVPLFAMLWSRIFLSEPIEANALVALAFILFGVYVPRKKQT